MLLSRTLIHSSTNSQDSRSQIRRAVCRPRPRPLIRSKRRLPFRKNQTSRPSSIRTAARSLSKNSCKIPIPRELQRHKTRASLSRLTMVSQSISLHSIKTRQFKSSLLRSNWELLKRQPRSCSSSLLRKMALALGAYPTGNSTIA